MKTKMLALALTILPSLAYADDFKDALKNGGEGLSKELQKTPAFRADFNPYNREMNEAIRPKAGEFWIAVIGDSSTTGAVSSPNFEPNWLNILDHIGKALQNLQGADLGPGPGVLAPFRVMYSRREFDEEARKNKGFEQKIESDLSQKIDTEEFSFGYVLAQKLNLSPNKLVLTGQDGVRVSSFARQLERVTLAGGGTLAPLVVASFVANDLCHPNNFVNPIEKFRASFEANLRAEFEAAAKFPAAPNGTRLVFLAPLDIVNVLTNSALLQQRVRFEGGTVTCQQVRDGTLPGGDLGKQMGQTLVGACRGILSGPDPQGRINQVKLLQEAQAEIIQKVLAEFNAKNLSIKAEYAVSTKTIAYQPGDLANDCFHPSQAGAARIADQLLTNELANVRP